MKQDFSVENHGSICLLRPLTRLAESWLDEHLDGDDVQYFGNAAAVEPRYLPPILEGIQNDGLTF